MGSIQCPCQSFIISNKHHVFEEFSSLREKCLALKDILIPDIIWDDFCKVAITAADSDRHQSILLNAFINGFLSKITSPVHRYLIEVSTIHKNLTQQYKKDLSERWILEGTPLAKHKKARSFRGKLLELLISEWLTVTGWRIDNLEALGGNFRYRGNLS